VNLLRLLRIHWDRALAVACIALGGVFLIVGWVRVGEEVLTAQQVPLIVSGGLGGLFLLGLGAMLWLSADLRDEWRMLDEIRRSRRLDVPEPAVTTPIPNGQVGDEATATTRRAPLRARRS
jgi:hypothetical protein